MEELLEEIQQNPAKILKMNPDELIPPLLKWQQLLRKQRLLLDLHADSILVVGDIHGDLQQVQRALHLLEEEKVDTLVFNGDIIDRGSEMIECIVSLMAVQLKYPKNIYFLRGNHELKAVNEIYGFRGYATGIFGSKVYDYFTRAFQQLPLAAKIGNWAFVSHGGVPKEQIYFHLMRLDVKEPEPETSEYAQLMWNDPDPKIDNYAPSLRGNGFYRFGKTAFDQFMDFHSLDLYIRAHQAFPEGYRWYFDNRLLSIFSSRAGPYHKITPHFVKIEHKKVSLINALALD
jgi:protein phosphatase